MFLHAPFVFMHYDSHMNFQVRVVTSVDEQKRILRSCHSDQTSAWSFRSYQNLETTGGEILLEGDVPGCTDFGE